MTSLLARVRRVVGAPARGVRTAPARVAPENHKRRVRPGGGVPDRGVRFEHNRTRPTRLPDDPGTTLATRLGGCFHAGAVGRPFGRRGWVWQRYVCISQILTHCLPYMTDTFLLQS